jgi:autotransporter-associated beta strand protein
MRPWWFGRLCRWAAVLAIAAAAMPAPAINLFWTGAGSTTAPTSGTWDNVTANQWNNGTGTSGNAMWTNANGAVFGGVDGTYGITIGVTGLSGTNISFSNSGYTLTSGSAITVTASANGMGVAVAAGKTATIGANVTLNLTGNAGVINAGANPAGMLIIDSGGTLDQPGSLGLHVDGGVGSTVQVKTGGSMTHTGNGSQFRIGLTANSSPLLDVEGGNVIIGPANPGLIIAASANSTGTVSIASGLISVTNQPITIGGNATAASGTINLNGGVINARQLTTTAGSSSTLNFNGGTLKAGSSGAAATFMNNLARANVRNAGGMIDQNGYDITIGQLLSHSIIGGDASTDGGLIVTNSRTAGSISLTNANTYNGPTIVLGGAKLVTTTRSTGGGAYSVADGGLLEVQVPIAGQTLSSSSLTLGTVGNLTNNFTLGANASTTVPAETVSGTVNLNGTVAVTVTGSGLTGPNTYLLMSYGAISGSGNFVAGSLPSVAGFVASLVNDTAAKQLKLVYAAAPQPVKWAIGDGNWDTTSLNWNLLSGIGPTNYTEGSTAVFDDTSSGTSPVTVTLTGDRSPSSISNNAVKTYILAGAGGLSGGPSIIKSGNGTLVLDNAGANNLSTITINGGAIQSGNGDANGALGTAAIIDNGVLALNRSDDFTFNNVLSGSGLLVQNGSDNVTLSAAGTFSGVTTVNSGLLTIGTPAALQSSTVSNTVPNSVGFAGTVTSATFGALAGSADLSLLNANSAIVSLNVGSNNASTVYSGSLSSGNLLKAGTGTLSLSGNSSLNNLQVTSPGSTLAITDGNITASALQIVTDNGTLQITGGNTIVTTDSRIGGANGVYNVSGGILNLPKVVIGSASAANTNNLMTVSGSGQVYQNQPGGAPPEALWIGGNNSGSGALLLKDNAIWNNSSVAANIVVIGNNGTGQGVFTIQDNATFTSATVIRVADLVGNVGTVNLNGGICFVNGFSKGAGAGIINVNGGQITALASSGNFFNGFTAASGTNAVNLVSGRLTLDNNGNTIAISNALSGAGGLVSQGGGILTLEASNTYAGDTVLNSGTLKLDGAAAINGSSSISNNNSTLDLSTATTPLAISGAFILNSGALNVGLANTNATVGTFGASGASTINVTSLPAIPSVPATVHVIKYTTAAPGLVDGNNNLTALTVGTIMPAVANPQGYLTNNAAGKYIDLIITNYISGPVITNQPVGDSAYPGGKAHFTVLLGVTNSSGLSYQWRKAGTALTDGGNISGSATPTLHVSNVALGDAVNYDVVVTNVSGSVTSSPAALTLLAPTNYEAAAAVAAGPAALYMFQENTDPSSGSATAFDYQGDLDGVYGTTAFNGFNGIVGPRPSDGFPGFDVNNLAVRFQGFVSNSHVAIPPLNLNTNTVTLAAWVNPGAPPANSGIIFSRSGGTVAGLNYTANLDANGNRTLGYTWNNDPGTYGWDSAIAPPSGIWSYIALVVTPTNASIYVMNTNGLLAASHPFAHVVQSFSGPTLIGEDGLAAGNREFDGSMYGAAIYTNALSQQQLANIYGAASGISNFPPVIETQPVSQTLYEQQNAAFNAAVSGTLPLTLQWQWFDGATYYNVANGGRITGADTASLVISNLTQSDATNLVLVASNAYGAVTSSVVTLSVNPVGPAQNITNSTVLSAGSDWNTGSAWSDGQSASISAVSEPGSAYFVVPSGGLRTPNVGSITQFPGNVITITGDGVFNTTLPAANIGALILKGAGTAYTKLVMNGGEILSFTDNNGPHVIGGTEMNVTANTPIAGLSSTGGRSLTINATLTGNGSVEYIGWPNTTFQPTAVTSLNIAGTNNLFNGTWSVDAGTLVGSTPGALGTNSITVSANGALQTTYDLNNTNSTLTLNGRLNLTQNDTFRNVIINGTTLAGGTYSYATLAASYPANFPTTWTGATGADSITNAAGSLTVLASGIASYPTNITFGVSGGTFTLTWPSTHLGWIAQSNSVGVASPGNWFDIPNSQNSTQLNISLDPTVTNVFFRLRHP